MRRNPRWRAVSCPELALGACLAFLCFTGDVSPAPPQNANPLELELLVRQSFLPGIPLLVRVEVRRADGSLARELWDAEASLSTGSSGVAIRPDRVTLRNGIGSVLMTIDEGSSAGVDDFLLAASLDGLEASRRLQNLEGSPEELVEGALPAGTVEWRGVVRVTGDVRVPTDTTLRVLPGALVLLDGVESGGDGSDIDVEGILESLGAKEQPVTFTARDPSRPWGEIHHQGAQDSRYLYTHITRAGRSPGGGHTGTGPAVRVEDSTVSFEFCALSDNAGKVLWTPSDQDYSELDFHETLLARSVMGPEISRTELLFEHSYIMEMIGQDDNDGIYIHTQTAGQVAVIREAIVAVCTDDGIDTLGADVTVEDSIVRDMTCDKGISVFGGEVTVTRCLLVDNDKGISAKSTGGSTVNVEHATFAGNRWSIESRLKSNAQSPENRIDITNSILRHNGVADGSEGCESNEPVGGRTIRTDFDPSYIQVHFSDVQSGFQVQGERHETWPGPGVDNISDDPRFMDAAGHDFHLQPSSPCIDSGDPGSPFDPDGTRADMGAFWFSQSTGQPGFVRGRINADESLDISDAIALLLHLFVTASPPIPCEGAADVDDSGDLNVTDSIALLDYLFRGGSPPEAPFDRCAEDPTADELDCEEPACF